MARYLVVGRWPQALQIPAGRNGIPLAVAIAARTDVELVRFLVRQRPESVRARSE